MTPEPKKYFSNKVSGNVIGCLSFRDDIKYASREYVLRIRTDIWAKNYVYTLACMYTERNVYTKINFAFMCMMKQICDMNYIIFQLAV